MVRTPRPARFGGESQRPTCCQHRWRSALPNAIRSPLVLDHPTTAKSADTLTVLVALMPHLASSLPSVCRELRQQRFRQRSLLHLARYTPLLLPLPRRQTLTLPRSQRPHQQAQNLPHLQHYRKGALLNLMRLVSSTSRVSSPPRLRRR